MCRFGDPDSNRFIKNISGSDNLRCSIDSVGQKKIKTSIPKNKHVHILEYLQKQVTLLIDCNLFSVTAIARRKEMKSLKFSIIYAVRSFRLISQFR